MNKLWSGAILVLSCAVLTARAGEAKKDLDLLQGAWTVVGYEEKGAKAADEVIKGMELSVKGEQMTIKDKDKVILEFKLKLDPTKKPKTIDFTHLSGEVKGQTDLGIYAIEGDMVRICVDDEGKIRPTEFKTSAQMPFNLVVLKKKAEPKK